MSKKRTTFKYDKQHIHNELTNVTTTWDLSGLYYKDENDPQIEKDIKKTEAAYKRFAKKWRDTDFESNIDQLRDALIDYEKLAGMSESSKPGRYFGFRSVLNTKDEVAEKQLTLISNRLRKASDQILFFTLRLGALSKERQKQCANEAKLAHYRYFLERVFRDAAHDLSEAEEKIIKLKSEQSHGRWIDATEKILSNRSIQFQGKTLHIPEALETIETLSTVRQKEQLWDSILNELKQIGEMAEHEFNAIINDVRSEEELRGYKKPYSATAIGYQDTEKSIENLVAAVSDIGFKNSTKFYKHKAKLKGKQRLSYVERNDTYGTVPEIPFQEATEICRDVFYGLKEEYGSIFDHMLQHGQIDVFPHAGKRGGAFMSEAIGHPTQVMLNHTSTFKALETLAHEMGHAIHSERSKHQTPFYQGHSITTAETASTLFENLVFDAVYEQADETRRVGLLHDRINRDIATIERQIAFFNCELDIHTTISKQGGLTNDELRALMQKHLSSYLGSGVEVRDVDGYSYVYIPHLRFGFYVYTYTFGMLMSTKMANAYKEDQAYIDEIDRFLSAGQSDSVVNIFKSIGINTTKQSVFEDALMEQRANIDTFIKLTS